MNLDDKAVLLIGTDTLLSYNSDTLQVISDKNNIIVSEPWKKLLSHPRNYVSLYEFTHSGDSIAIFTAQDYREGNADNFVNYEIDKQSKLVVKLDREWIWRNRGLIDLGISVQAKLKEEALRVPGYSETGEDFKLSRLNRQVTGLFVAFLTLNGEVKELARRAPSKGDSSLDVAFNGFATESDTTKLTDGLGKVIAVARTESERISEFLLLWPDVGHCLSYVQEPKYDWFLPILSELTKNHPENIRQAASVITEQYVPRLKQLDADAKRLISEGRVGMAEKDNKNMKRVAPLLLSTIQEQRTVVSAIRMGLENLLLELKGWTWFDADRFTGVEKIRQIDQQLLGMLKDTEILISRTNARVDDSIDVDIINVGGHSDAKTVFPVRLIVKRFGLRRSLTESFMFFYRMHINTPDTAGPGNLSTTDPTPVNFEPYPGLSLIWSGHSRKDKWFTRFLAPGFGFNVSFTRFGTSISEYQVPDGSTFGEVTTSASSEIGVCVGPVLTFFDGALQLSRGWMLSNVDSDREYWSIGFSFLKAAKGIKSAVD